MSRQTIAQREALEIVAGRLTAADFRSFAKPKKRSKYGAVKTVVDGIRFASKAEAKRWAALKLLERAGKIMGLRRQVAYVLAPAVKIAGEKRRRPALRYTADAVYWETDSVEIVEDTKGKSDTAFRIRQHLMKSVHGIDVRIVK